MEEKKRDPRGAVALNDQPLAYPRKVRKLLEFSEVVAETGCWEWRRSLSPAGYGKVSDGAGGSVGAHRQSYELLKGDIPEGLFVCHQCDNRRCINPDHLWLGTNQDNMRDMFEKGRDRCGVSNEWQVCEDHPRAKITNATALEIVKVLKETELSQKKIAECFSINPSAVTQINLGKCWSKVTGASAKNPCRPRGRRFRG